AGIFDGDYVIVKEQHDAHDGEIVVALIDESATVKTFYREKDQIRLQPENDAMNPIYVKDASIIGRVTGLIRSIS
ncbi:MAG: transcriptional repressor LexA, partial [Atopobiaceae bacterium]|nr:transcriptional repressor LexA [Atopobiaceae bacterium]